MNTSALVAAAPMQCWRPWRSWRSWPSRARKAAAALAVAALAGCATVPPPATTAINPPVTTPGGIPIDISVTARGHLFAAARCDACLPSAPLQDRRRARARARGETALLGLNPAAIAPAWLAKLGNSSVLRTVRQGPALLAKIA